MSNLAKAVQHFRFERAFTEGLQHLIASIRRGKKTPGPKNGAGLKAKVRSGRKGKAEGGKSTKAGDSSGAGKKAGKKLPKGEDGPEKKPGKKSPKTAEDGKELPAGGDE